MRQQPNLFSFATKELSQDAVLCWLLSWADSAQAAAAPALNQVGKDFISLCLNRAGREPIEIEQVDVARQVDHVDVRAVINGHLPLVIENKVGTREHSDQLSRYHDVARGWGFTDEPLLVYVQTGYQDDYSSVEAAGYAVITRKDFFKLQASPTGQRAISENDIFREFAVHLQRLEHLARAHQVVPLAEWEHHGAWFGFFEELQERLMDGGFGHVPNPNGGFPGFWWGGPSERGDVHPYLQLEGDKLCVKISTDRTDPGFRRRARIEWSEHITNYAQARDIPLIRPARLRSGTHMTVAILKGDYRATRADGSLSLTSTVEYLQQITHVFNNAVTAKLKFRLVGV